MKNKRDLFYNKYLPKTQFMIDVLNSCETDEQVDVSCEWAKSLLLQWTKYEDRILEKRHGGWSLCSRRLTMRGEMSKLHDMFALARDRKIAELSKNEEN